MKTVQNRPSASCPELLGKGSLKKQREKKKPSTKRVEKIGLETKRQKSAQDRDGHKRVEMLSIKHATMLEIKFFTHLNSIISQVYVMVWSVIARPLLSPSPHHHLRAATEGRAFF